MREGGEIGRGFTGLHAPGPFLANRSLESKLKNDVEGVIGVLQHCAENTVEFVLAQVRIRDLAGEVDVSELINAERHRIHAPVSLKQPLVNTLVILIGITGDKGIDGQRVLADTQGHIGHELVSARQHHDVSGVVGVGGNRLLARQLVLDAVSLDHGRSRVACGVVARVVAHA